jgi:hypothetical protein
MTKPTDVKAYNNFVKGLITEANPLTYPEGSSKDELNFVLNRDGSRQRRLGMDYEEKYTLSSVIPTVTVDTGALSIHEWHNAGGDGNTNFAVIQIGDTLYFHGLNGESISAEAKTFTVDLNTFSTGYSTNFGGSVIATSTGRGTLFVVSKDTEPFYIEYDQNTDTISTTQITIEVRDFDGVLSTESAVALTDDLTTTPTVLDRSHEYNLKNQGWDTGVLSSTGPTNKNAISAWRDGFPTTYPANSHDVVFGYFQDGLNRKWKAVAITNQKSTGNTRTSKGHFIFNAFIKDRDSVTVDQAWLSAGTISTEREKNRPSAVEFYASRVWYAGVESAFVTGQEGDSNNSNIWFSQILTDNRRAGRCYQDGDPVDEESNALLPNDGGVVRIPEIGVIKQLISTQQYLLVFADNGVWSISGALDSGFTADDFQVRKISDIGVLSPNSVVRAEGNVFYWSDGGIYVASPEQVSGTMGVQNLSETTIQTFFNDIPYQNKKFVWGNYDPFSRKVSWAFSNLTTFDGSNQAYRYNRLLELDLVLQAWSVSSVENLATNSPYITGFVQTVSAVSNAYELEVVDLNGVVVVNAAAETVFVNRTADGTSQTNTKFLTIVPQDNSAQVRYTFSRFKNLSFKDWTTQDAESGGINFKSFLLTGVELFGDLTRDKRAHRIWCFFDRTETGFSAVSANQSDYANPSGCFVSTRFDFSSSGTSGKWSPRKQMYKLNPLYVPVNAADTFDYGYDVVVVEDSVTGMGKGMSLYFESEDGKDCRLLGWGVQVSINRKP